MTTQTLETAAPRTASLPDGRNLGYAEFGDPNGRPVFAFHGFPSSRGAFSVADGAAREKGVRLISVERPGMGASTFQPNRKLLDWPADISALADALGLQRFAVMGVSGGGPYVAACAYRIADRLTSAAIISGLGPVAEIGTKGMMTVMRLLLGCFRYAPPVANAMIGLMGRMGKNSDPEIIRKRMRQMFPEPDRRVLRERPDVLETFVQDPQDSFAQGSRGPALDGRILARPWGFRLQDIRIPVHVWHGDEDRNVPLSQGEYQARALPHGTLHLCPGEGHLLAFDHMPEILQTLALAQ